MSEKSALVSTLEKAVVNLQMPSETDAPFQVVFFPSPVDEVENADEKNGDPASPNAVKVAASKETIVTVGTPLTPAQIAGLVGAPADSALETRDLDEFFKGASAVEDWMNDEEKATAARFSELLQLLKKELKGAQVVLWGDAKKNVAILGKCEGGVAGVTTLIVET